MSLVSIHTHVETSITASIMPDFIARAKALGRTHIAYTDIGLMTGLYKFYKMANKAGLKTIPGIEIYFKDTQTVPSTLYPKAGYFTITLYPTTQSAFTEICKLSSKSREKYLDRLDNEIPLYSWEDLESLGNKGIEAVLAGPHSMLVKPLLSGKKLTDLKSMVERLKRMFNLSVALVSADQDAYYRNVLSVTSQLGVLELYNNDRIDTIKAGKIVKNIPAFDIERGGHNKIIGLHRNGVYNKANLNIQSFKFVEKFTKLKMGNVIAMANKAHLAAATMFELNVLSSDYAYMASKEDKKVQDIRLLGGALRPEFYLQSEEEYISVLAEQGIPLDKITASILNTKEWATKFDGFKLSYEWNLPVVTDNPNKYMMDLIKKSGRMQWDNPEWTARVKLELEVISRNGVYDLLPYFFPIAMVFDYYKTNGRLTGPGRGSVGGSLLAYIMGITHINPLDFDLPFERFFSMDRIKNKKLPDIDVDLPDRELLVGLDGHSGYLHEMFGDKAGQISTRGMIRLKSAIKDVNRIFNKGIVSIEIEKFSESLPVPPQGVSDKDFVFGFKDSDGNSVPGFFETSKELQSYARKYPEEWAIVSRTLGIPRQNSRHASAFVIADKPLHHIIPMMEVNGVKKVTQWEAKEVEGAGLIKFDFLCISQLIDIENCLKLLNKKDKKENSQPGWFNHNGKETFIWDLPKNDMTVAAMMGSGDTETTFQTNTKSMLPFVTSIKPVSIIDYATILALVRPGPLDFIDEKTGLSMAAEYVERRHGRGTIDLPELADLLPETYGIIVFQEQLTKVAKTLANFSGEKAEILRENMCKKRKKELMLMKPDFINGAKAKVSDAVAHKIWDMMETFGQYGFSIIHAVEYAMITYATAFLKAHYPLEWWSGVLSNSNPKEINEKYWKHVRNLMAPPDINLSGTEMVIDYNTGKIRSKMTMVSGLANAGVNAIISARPYTDINDLVKKDTVSPSMARKLIAVGVMDSLFPKHFSLLDKMQAYENEIEKIKYEEKLATHTAEKIDKPASKKKAPILKQGTINTAYVGLGPLEMFSLRKKILPSMPISLTDLVLDLGLVDKTPAGMGMVEHPEYKNKSMAMLNGEQVAAFESREFESFKTLACAAYVVDAKEFTFKKDTSKKGLRVIIDTDNYLREMVMWPDYDTGILSYPEGLAEGAIGIFYLNKRAKKLDASIGGVRLLKKGK
jgi:DNA-directed DNA polymerase III PolC